MKIDFKPYSNYKKSKFDYIGKLPEHWDEKRVKFLTPKVRTGTTPSSNGPDFFSDGEIFWYNPGDFTFENIKLNESKKKLHKNFFEESNTNKYPAGSVLIVGIGATLGKVGLAKKESYSNQQINAILPSNKYDSTFLAYTLFCYTDTLKVYSNATTLGIMNQEKTKNFNIPYPNIKEQTQIANFLDQKTAQIDKLIAQKEKLLKLLAEKRTAIITQAVTKGLNPNVEMKDSGIDWLGEIPKDWSVKPLKFAVKLINEKLDELGDLPYLGLEHIESWTAKRIVDENAKADGVVSKFQKNDVLFGKLRPYLAKVYLSNFTGGASTEALVMRASKEVVPGFLKFYLVSDLLIDVINSSTYGSKMPRASWNFIGKLPMVLPNVVEQKEIVTFLTDKICKFDNSIDKINQSKRQLKEYREAIITAAVTGQIDVRGETDKPSSFRTLSSSKMVLEHSKALNNEKLNDKNECF